MLCHAVPRTAATVFDFFFFPPVPVWGARGILSEWKLRGGTKGAFGDKGGVCRLQRAAASVPTRSAASGEMIRVNYAEENFRTGGRAEGGWEGGREGGKRRGRVGSVVAGAQRVGSVSTGEREQIAPSVFRAGCRRSGAALSWHPDRRRARTRQINKQTAMDRDVQ